MSTHAAVEGISLSWFEGKELGGVFCGADWFSTGTTTSKSVNPSTQQTLATIKDGSAADLEKVIAESTKAKAVWQKMPAPKRGEIVRQIGNSIRDHMDDLSVLISKEMGKIMAEARGEVQEFIDICDFAVGLSRTINGTIIPSEREGHAMWETWNPLGIVGVISAFNFPCAVYGWNAALALITGNVCIWKPAPSTPLIAIAVTNIMKKVFEKNNLPSSICNTIITGPEVSSKLCEDKRIGLVSFTGSTAVGKKISNIVNNRFGKLILELGGNNAIIVMDDADMNLALRGVLFSAVGTAGQRCTTCRRLLLHSKVYDKFLKELTGLYKQVKIGDPTEKGVLCGPLHTKASVTAYINAINTAKAQGGKVLTGGNVLSFSKVGISRHDKGNQDEDSQFVEPTIIEIAHDAEIVQHETFAPILYVIKINELSEAIAINNNVPQGLSSSLFTTNQRSVFEWTGPNGSDCGIVNVNIGTSGAEIGGAFGGEKETGGGRESGSDSWKAYCRRGTATINYSDTLPLAQGIQFGQPIIKDQA